MLTMQDACWIQLLLLATLSTVDRPLRFHNTKPLGAQTCSSASMINIQSDARLVRSPTTGYHCNMFMLKTLDNFKLVIAGSMTSYGSVPCGKWDSATGEVLSHDAFQPFRWPVMRNDSPTWVDFKIKLEGHLLVHLELRGYRSDQDMSVQINHVTDSILWLLQETAFIPTCVVTVFQGWRVCACSWEVGGRIYAISEGGIVVALDYPLCHMEIRLVATSSADAFGQDADRLEFRFYSAADCLDVACSTCAAPPSWLIVSRVSGPTLIKDAGAESGIAAAFAVGFDPCWLDGRDGVPLGGGPVESNPSNLRLITDCPLFRSSKLLWRRMLWLFRHMILQLSRRRQFFPQSREDQLFSLLATTLPAWKLSQEMWWLISRAILIVVCPTRNRKFRWQARELLWLHQEGRWISAGVRRWTFQLWPHRLSWTGWRTWGQLDPARQVLKFRRKRSRLSSWVAPWMDQARDQHLHSLARTDLRQVEGSSVIAVWICEEFLTCDKWYDGNWSMPFLADSSFFCEALTSPIGSKNDIRSGVHLGFFNLQLFDDQLWSCLCKSVRLSFHFCIHFSDPGPCIGQDLVQEPPLKGWLQPEIPVVQNHDRSFTLTRTHLLNVRWESDVASVVSTKLNKPGTPPPFPLSHLLLLPQTSCCSRFIGVIHKVASSLCHWSCSVQLWWSHRRSIGSMLRDWIHLCCLNQAAFPREASPTHRCLELLHLQELQPKR